MTTIATDGKTIASDSQQTGEFINQVDLQKLFRIDGVVYGVCGTVTHFTQYIEWVKSGRNLEQKPDIKNGEFGSVFILDGEAFFEDDDFTPIKVGLPHAIGSGASFAMGALLSGASPKRAVEIACKLDPNSGGNIVSMRV